MAGICQIIGLKRNRSSNKNFRNPLRKEETVFIDVITEQPTSVYTEKYKLRIIVPVQNPIKPTYTPDSGKWGYFIDPATGKILNN